MDVEFEAVLLEDRAEIVALGELVNEKHIVPFLSPQGQVTMRNRRKADIEETIDSPIYQTIKAVLKNKIIGYIAWRNSKYIAQLFVNSENHGMGIGRALVDQMSLSGSTMVELKSSTNAVGFYEKLGFTVTADVQRIEGIDYVPMVFKSLHSGQLHTSSGKSGNP